MSRKKVDVAVIIPDASPLVTLAGQDRLDLLQTFTAPIHIVDQVKYEVIKPKNDPQERIAAWLVRMGNQIVTIETFVGKGFQSETEKGNNPASGNLGEIAVDEYASRIALEGSPNFVPLVLFEDPDVLDLRIARLDRVHLLNTAGWIKALQDDGIIDDGVALMKAINAERKTPMDPYERPGQTSRIRSVWTKRRGS
jgi:hypothetical protein